MPLRSDLDFDAAGRDGKARLAKAYAQAVTEALRGPGSQIPHRSGRLKRSLTAEAYQQGDGWRIRVVSTFSWAGAFLNPTASFQRKLIEQTLAVNAATIRARTAELAAADR